MLRLVSATALSLALLAGCAPTLGNRTTVQNTGSELLKLRAGPGLGYDVKLGLPDGTALIRRDCVRESMQLWCRVALADAPTVTGYVAEDYLSD